MSRAGLSGPQAKFAAMCNRAALPLLQHGKNEVSEARSGLLHAAPAGFDFGKIAIHSRPPAVGSPGGCGPGGGGSDSVPAIADAIGTGPGKGGAVPAAKPPVRYFGGRCP
jgi:hypothetical protein